MFRGELVNTLQMGGELQEQVIQSDSTHGPEICPHTLRREGLRDPREMGREGGLISLSPHVNIPC